MKAGLQERILRNGNLARELKECEGYRLVLQKLADKLEKARNDGLSSETIQDLKYNKGLIDGLQFFESFVEQTIRQAEVQRKKISK